MIITVVYATTSTGNQGLPDVRDLKVTPCCQMATDMWAGRHEYNVAAGLYGGLPNLGHPSTNRRIPYEHCIGCGAKVIQQTETSAA